MKIAIIIAAALISTGCSSLHSAADFSKKDRDAITSSVAPSGPTMVVLSEYQFVPNINAMADKCRAELEKKVGSLVGKDVKMSTDRNIFSGTTSCKASL